jgi:hypothetical protein
MRKPGNKSATGRKTLRPQAAFDHPANADRTAPHLGPTMNCGLALDEAPSARPMTGAARTAWR